MTFLDYFNTVLHYFKKAPWKSYKTTLNPIKQSFYSLSLLIQD